MPGRFPSGRCKRWRLVPASRRLVCLGLSSGEVDVDDDPAGWGSSARGGCAECASRKGALYVIDMIRNAPFGNVATTECAFPYSTGCRMRFSSPAQTPTHLTQKRILAVGPHAKAHSNPGSSRKSALCPRHLTQRPQSAPFRENFIQNALFRTARVAECAFP